MVYKKYIKKDGKIYGPYYYHSRRVNGKVISEYHGSPKKINYKKFAWIFLGISLLMVLIYGLGFIGNGISGRAVLNLDANYQEGQSLEGNLRFVLREGELIPASSRILFETSGKKYEYNLNEIISDEPIEGEFYISGGSISGDGLGYGIKGISELFPTIYFTLEIFSSSEPSPIGNVTEELASEENQTQEQIPEKNVTEKRSSGLPITGMVSLGIGNEVDGEVSFGNDFVFELSEGATVEIVPGSVETDTERLSDDMIELTIQENRAIVTTSYSEIKYGFGETHLGNDEKVIDINLSALNMVFEQGDLKVSLVYSNKEIVSLSTILESGKPVTAETPTQSEEEPKQTEDIATKQNITINETLGNITIEEPPQISNVLTEEEENILDKEFGNISIKITRAERGKRVLIRYELEEYWFEATYDADLSQEDLEVQMEADKIKWLKDIVKSLSKEEPPAEEIEELLGNYSI